MRSRPSLSSKSIPPQGVVNDIPAIRQAMDAANHPALLMVDTIASLGIMPYEMDQWRVDLTVAAGQKGLMTPARLELYCSERSSS